MQGWNKLIEGAEFRWQFPSCFGTRDRKHIWIILLKNSGPEYYKFQGFDYWLLHSELEMGDKFSDKFSSS